MSQKGREGWAQKEAWINIKTKKLSAQKEDKGREVYRFEEAGSKAEKISVNIIKA